MPNYPGKRKGTRRIVIWAKLEGEAKSRPREWVITGTKTDADDYEARKRIDLLQQKGAAEFRTVPTFEVFCVERYKPHAKSHLKESTWSKVRRYQVETLCKHFGGIKLSELAVLDVERFKEQRTQGGTGASSVNNELRVFRTILNYAKSLGIPIPELKFKKLPVRGQGRVKAWTDDEVQRLYKAAREKVPELVPMLIFLLNTGCRKGEAIAAEWSWMDIEAEMVRIPSNPAWQPKNGLPREVPMGDAVRAALAAQPRSSAYVFPTKFGTPYATFPKDLYWEVRDAAKLTGGVHTTRHTFASHFLKKLPDMKLLASVMGHSHQRVTELYSHMLPDHLARARNAVSLLPEVSAVPKKRTRNHG